MQMLTRTIACGALLTLLPTLLPTASLAQEGIKIKDVAYWLDLCELQTQSGKHEKALESCEKALSLRQGRRDGSIWATYSGIQLQLKQYPEAIASASQALERSRNNSLALTYQCIAYRELKQEAKALELCNEALRTNGDWGTQSPTVAWRYRGLILNQDKQYEQALVAFERTLLLEPQDSLTRLYECEALLNLGLNGQAILACEAALEGDGNWGSENPGLAWYYQGKAQQLEGKNKLAIAAYDQAIVKDPNNYKIWTDQGGLLSKLKRNTEALTSYNRAVELKENHARALVGQCSLLNKLKKYKPAAEACQTAIKGDGIWWELGAAQAWNQLSHALTAQGEHEEALAAANRAVGIAPDFAEAWSDRAVILWSLKRNQEALASNQRALALNAADPKILANQARLLRASERNEEAIAAYMKALELDPESANTWSNLSVVFWHTNKFSSALQAAEQAIRVQPDLAIAWQNRALALASLGRYRESQATYEYTLELNAENAEAWTGLGLVLGQQQEYASAQQALTVALELDPNQALAQEALESLTEYQQQLSPQ